jgi:hypothetical protein
MLAFAPEPVQREFHTEGSIDQTRIGQMSWTLDDHTVGISNADGARPPADRIIALNADVPNQVFIDNCDFSGVSWLF